MYTFENRKIFNHPLVSIMPLNLPEDEEKANMYSDVMASAIETIGARLAFLASKASLAKVQALVKSAVSDIYELTTKPQSFNMDAINDITSQISSNFHVLSEAQEDVLTRKSS